MYNLIQSPVAVARLAAEAPPLAGAMAIAEIFYKFHSFSLECLAFLPTWFLLSYALTHAYRLARGARRSPG
jgi:hypothetical protein